MADLSDQNKAQVLRFINYFKAKRERLLQEREAEKAEFQSDRLSDDQAIFSNQDAEGLLDAYHAQFAGAVREGLEGFVNLSAVYVAQVLQRAEMSGVAIDGDLAAIEDQHSLDAIAGLAAGGLAPVNLSKRASNLVPLGAPVSPSGPPPPPADFGVAARMQELEAENAQMRERYLAMQQQVSDLSGERSQLLGQLEQAGIDASSYAEHVGSSSQFQDLKAIVNRKSAEVKELRRYIMDSGLPLPGTEGGFELQAEDD
mmetsp:Transcript_76949/g.135608  ORF Transcript_76949/g.135608 Transcript_76949/m.135608 type:complete len:257 (-) Transcript_76949:78-848(-)|eukprot:CAMPEP_0197655682 /NCGR_PEP_ID=MMETSP1338-20131121/39604_1 /TAXON_ID=43686 ORGANISM="Pelagodinium beii, Strain RCC1491" /NCGR_SAMPLE_ID=MMETSP1338 /ASSEMBLY_ACC=CAM_ASM_000754 /LENGTH=256 /DNA_ID=CAMNT_0043231381 /DNA_START=64 /DNA_END=834 /DNA_ORIENTATION=+